MIGESNKITVMVHRLWVMGYRLYESEVRSREPEKIDKLGFKEYRNKGKVLASISKI